MYDKVVNSMRATFIIIHVCHSMALIVLLVGVCLFTSDPDGDPCESLLICYHDNTVSRSELRMGERERQRNGKTEE